MPTIDIWEALNTVISQQPALGLIIGGIIGAIVTPVVYWMVRRFGSIIKWSLIRGTRLGLESVIADQEKLIVSLHAFKADPSSLTSHVRIEFVKILQALVVRFSLMAMLITFFIICLIVIVTVGERIRPETFSQYIVLALVSGAGFMVMIFSTLHIAKTRLYELTRVLQGVSRVEQLAAELELYRDRLRSFDNPPRTNT